jgi:iron complex outermembrane receptor protein
MDHTDRLSACRRAGALWPWLAGAVALLALPAGAAELAAVGGDFAELSIEELANIQITSVSKKAERLADAAASVFVITADDIRRAGVDTLADALRLAPNLQVAQESSGGYAISARGLNGSNNSAPNKLLVLIDGRSVYSPLFSGVFWDAQDVLLEDIDRIEVISGPGGTLWGVNAVNGVINISTRAARETQGSLAMLSGGPSGSAAAFRYGATDSAGVAWRAYGKYVERSHTELASGAPVDDGLHRGQLGLRADWTRGGDQFSVLGTAFTLSEEQPAPGAISVEGTTLRLGTISSTGASLTGRWEHLLDGGGRLSVQAYLDHTRRTVPPTFGESLDIADLQFQHSLPALGAHTLVWGANYRYSWDRVRNSDIIAFLPADTNQRWASLFAQDEVALRADLKLTLGARVERNDYTGNEVLPTVRLGWKLAPAHALWSAVSRTVRAPSRLDADAYVPGHPPFLLRGGLAVQSETATVYELGYRGQPTAGFSYSATLFHNVYDHVRTQEIDPSFTYLTFASQMEGQATGIEMWGNYQLTPYWRLSGGLMALHETMTLKPGSNDAAGPGTVGKDPAHTLQLRSSFNLADDKELDFGVSKVAALANPAVPAYTALSARFGWKLRRNVELSLAGQNLNGSHAEYGPLATRSEIPRTVSLRLVWQN